MTIRYEIRIAVLTLAIVAGFWLSGADRSGERAACASCDAVTETS